eukprot:PITA_31343
MDVKSTFLNGDLEEEVYIEQPEGFILGNDAKLVCKLRKALYGLKQAPRAWYYRLDKYLHQQGFSKGSVDSNLYTKMDSDKLLVIVVYVDDIIFGSNEESMSRNFASVMLQEFEMFLLVGIVGSFQENPKESHLQAVKMIFKYLQGTHNFGLWYPRDTNLTLHAYIDVDWAGSVDHRKSTSGGSFYMGSRLVSWFNKKQSSIALSIAKTEYVAVASCCTQLLWMMQTLQDIQITCTPPISILCDNTSAISISKNLVMHSKTKHIPIKYHFLREQVLEQKVILEYVPSKEQVVDIFTKPLPRETFEYLKQKLGVVFASSCC